MILGDWYRKNGKVQQTEDYAPLNERCHNSPQKSNPSLFKIDRFDSNDVRINEVTCIEDGLFE